MPSSERRNPASSHALTVFEVRELVVGTRLLVCNMNDYPINRRLGDPLERRVDWIRPVVFRGTMPRPASHFDAGTGSWVVLDTDLRFGMSSTVEVKRRMRSSFYGYEPSALGLTVAVNPHPGSRRAPSRNEWDCVILPEHEASFRSEYPRRVRQS